MGRVLAQFSAGLIPPVSLREDSYETPGVVVVHRPGGLPVRRRLPFRWPYGAHPLDAEEDVPTGSETLQRSLQEGVHGLNIKEAIVPWLAPVLPWITTSQELSPMGDFC
ncbi:hypothetical protein AAG570_005659 [Ranatra chinensis]|uniref:Uncharacterized protein n=1 Tax=Ranatra chinensis TaxID=642074 RepID=A0ABD0YGG1_9HEMI